MIARIACWSFSKYFLRKDVRLSHAFDLKFFDYILIYLKILVTFNLKLNLLKRLIKKKILPRLASLNLTHFAWGQLINRFGVMKIDLLTLNPTNQNITALQKKLNLKEMAYVLDVLEEQHLTISKLD